MTPQKGVGITLASVTICLPIQSFQQTNVISCLCTEMSWPKCPVTETARPESPVPFYCTHMGFCGVQSGLIWNRWMWALLVTVAHRHLDKQCSEMVTLLIAISHIEFYSLW